MYLLIVEDEQFIREGIKVLLSGIEDIDKIDTAENGEEAWQKILSMEQFPDILITDIRMPGMSGLELSERIRRHTQSTVIIFISGYEDFIYAKKSDKYRCHRIYYKAGRSAGITGTCEKVSYENRT